MKIKIMLFVLAMFVCFPVVAQEESEQTLVQSVPSATDTKTAEEKKREFLKPIRSNLDDPYVKSDLTNLANAYWAFGVLDLTSKNDVDDYLIITNCDVYSGYFKNEFEWAKVREAAIKHIEANKMKFPRRFEFTRLMYLDRYDTEQGKFEIGEESKITNVRKLLMSDNKFTDTKCGQKVSLSGFPMNVALKMPLAFSLIEIPVKESIAKEYIAFAERNYGPLSGAKAHDRNQRPVYVRFRATFEQFGGYAQDGADRVNATMFGSLDHVDVFADEAQKINIYSKTFERLENSFVEEETPKIEAVP